MVLLRLCVEIEMLGGSVPGAAAVAVFPLVVSAYLLFLEFPKKLLNASLAALIIEDLDLPFY
jgi:hypothetical protein